MTLHVRERYCRSVDLVRDFQRQDRLSGYIVTQTAANSLLRIMRGLRPGATERAWSLVGPYGSGKSAFALFLSAALDYAVDAPLDDGLVGQLNKLSPEAFELWGDKAGRHDRNRLLPVLVTGDRQPLSRKLLLQLHEASARLWPRRKPKEHATLLTLVQRIETDHDFVPPAADVASLLGDLLKKVASSTAVASGILLIIDEFGKHLEFSSSGESDDAYLLQLLAESSARSGSTPFVLITLQHQALDAYASSTSRTQLNEWRKVQGRFEQVNFQESSEQLFALMGHAVYGTQQSLSKVQRHVVDRGTERLGDSFRTLDSSHISQHLSDLVPLHPTVAVALPSLFRRIGQNERSLFAFLASEEPRSLRDILRNEPDTEWYRLHHLYDYLISTFSASLLTGPNAKRWSELESAVKRTAGVSVAAINLIKTIGVIGLIGESPGLKADHAGLAYALGMADEDSAEMLESLVERRLVVWRAFANTFALWEGSDVDIEERLRVAEGQVASTKSRALRDYLPAKSVVARRYSIETGTLRYFNVVYLDDRSAESELIPSSAADGTIVLLIGNNRERIGEMMRVVRSAARNVDRPVLLGVIDRPLAIGEIIAHIERLRWVQKNTEALNGDAVARRELQARLRNANDKLRLALGGGRVGDAIQAFASTAKWYQGEDQISLESERQFNEVISKCCFDAYWATPTITNEILNRGSISTTAARAQRLLLEAMVDRRSEPRLGIKGAPPELSIYYSVLQGTQLHVESSTGIFEYPDLRHHTSGNWRELGESVDKLLNESSLERLPISAIADRWKKPPFGLKDGIIPVILAQVLLSREDDLVVYENDLFVPVLTAPHLERLSKDQRSFSIKSVAVSGLSAELFSAVLEIFPLSAEEKEASRLGSSKIKRTAEPKLLQIVRPLVQIITSLPEYTLSTRDLTPVTRAFRDTILRATDPLKLVVSDLPKSLQVNPEADKVEFVNRIRASVRELQHHYTRRIVDLIYDQTLRSVGEDPSDDTARISAAQRAAALGHIVTELRLKGFLMRLAEVKSTREHWCESVASLVANKPPRKWVDSDRQKFEVEIVALGRRMRDTESAAFQHQSSHPVGGEAYRAHFAVTQASGEQISRVVRLSSEELQKVQTISTKLQSWLLDEGADDNDMRLAVLAHGWESIADDSIIQG